MRHAVEEFDELMANVRAALDRGTGRNLTATIALYRSEWFALIGRGRPFGAAEAATALGIPRRSIHTAMYRIGRRSLEGVSIAHTSTGPREGSHVTNSNSDSGWIERSPYFRSGDHADYERNRIIRSDERFGVVRIDPTTGMADYSIR